MSDLFNRKIELVTDVARWNYPDINIEYEIKFDWDENPDLAEYKLYNLSPDSIASLRIGQGIRITAGYGNDLGTMHNGKIYDIYVQKNGTDTVTHIKAINTLGEYTSAKILETFAPGLSGSYVLKYLFDYMNTPVNLLQLGHDFVLGSAFVASGYVLDVIKSLLPLSGSRLVIRNNSFMVMPDNQGIETGFLLSADTGLLNIERIDKQRNGGQYKIKMLLNHAISSRSLLEVRSIGFNGIVMVLEGSHKDFITEVEVVPVG